MKQLFVITFALLVVSAGAAPKVNSVKGNKHNPPPPPIQGLTLDPSKWQFMYGVNTLVHPAQTPGVPGWYFDFPETTSPAACIDLPCPQVDYLLQSFNAPVTAATLVVTLSIAVTAGDPQFLYQMESGNTCVFPAHVRCLLWSGLGDSSLGDDRWWSNPIAVELSALTGTATMRIPVDPAYWSNVYGVIGSNDLTGWRFAFANPTYIGFTFGGGCFFGHGVSVYGGSARFTLNDIHFE